MEIGLLHEMIKRGEDSRRQFKKNVTNADAMPVPGLTVDDSGQNQFKVSMARVAGGI
jgi:hypothetical protein